MSECSDGLSKAQLLTEAELDHVFTVQQREMLVSQERLPVLDT